MGDINYSQAWAQAKDELKNETALPDIARSLRNLIRSIGDQSNLILDPELESYYAVDILFNRIPFLATPLPAEKNGISVAHSLEGLNHAAQIIARDTSQDSPAVTKSIAVFRESWTSSGGQTVVSQNHALILQRAGDVAQATGNLLDNLLHQRMDRELQHRQIAITFIIGLYIALATLVIFTMRNYVLPA